MWLDALPYTVSNIVTAAFMKVITGNLWYWLIKAHACELFSNTDELRRLWSSEHSSLRHDVLMCPLRHETLEAIVVSGSFTSSTGLVEQQLTLLLLYQSCRQSSAADSRYLLFNRQNMNENPGSPVVMNPIFKPLSLKDATIVTVPTIGKTHAGEHKPTDH